jgi:hypothetical protein
MKVMWMQQRRGIPEIGINHEFTLYLRREDGMSPSETMPIPIQIDRPFTAFFDENCMNVFTTRELSIIFCVFGTA